QRVHAPTDILLREVLQDPDTFRATPRFRLIRKVGAGGAGVVYEAFDREHGSRVALKTLRRMNPDALLRFKNEFRSLQDIHHPNLVSLGELFESQGQWFFSMEFVEGVDFLAWVRRSGKGEAPQTDTFHDATLVDSLTPEIPSSAIIAVLSSSGGHPEAPPSA